MSARKRSTNAVKEETVDSFALLAPFDEPTASPPDPAPQAEMPADAAELVSIELPIGPFRANQCRPSHVELRLSPKQGRALQRLLNGLVARYGKGWAPRDYSFADVVRWLLEQLPDAEPEH